MSGEALSVAVIGCGRMGRIRAEGASRFGARVIEVCDVDAARARGLAADLPGCVAQHDPDDLAWDRLDAVFVCTPPYVRGPVELRAIERGIPFLVEKPVGLGVARLADVVAALARRPVLSAVGYMNRYRPSVLRARELLRGESILGMACNWVGTPYRVPWWSRLELSGGPVNEQTTHLVDLARFLVGEIEAVQGIASSDETGGVGTTATFNLSFRDSGVFSLFYSCAGSCKMINLQVFTPAARVALNGWDFRLEPPHADPAIPADDEDRNAVFHAEVAAFLEAAASGNPSTVLCDFEDGLRTQAVVDALVRSLASAGVEPVDALR